jgi:hypothetical protein
VCSVAGSGEHGLDDTGREGYASLKQLLERSNYKTRAISLLEKAEVPKDCSVAAGGRPQIRVPAADRRRIEDLRRE